MDQKVEVMVLDDEPIVGERLQDYLQKKGMSVETFTESQKAIDRLKEKTFDLAEYFFEVSYPFYYRPFIAFQFNLPLEFLQHQKLYDQWLNTIQQELPKSSPSTLSGITTLLDNYYARMKYRIHRNLRHHKGCVNWSERVGRSNDWLIDQISGCSSFPQLQEFCRNSLRRSKPETVPMALFALPYQARISKCKS